MKNSKILARGKKLVLLLFACILLTLPVVGQSVTTIVSFDGNVLPDPGGFGGSTQGPTPLAQGRDGRLYGTTLANGIPGNINASGTFFALKPGSPAKFTPLHSFHQNLDDGQGQYPSSGVTLSTNGAFYGTTYQGGTNVGTVFKITSGGTLTTYNFTNPSQQGNEPAGGLLQAANGSFYGTTTKGGTHGCGTIFKMTASGTITPLYDFSAGCFGPFGNLIQGRDGNIYGTNWSGGKTNMGWIFKIDPSGHVTDLHDFQGAPDGAFPGAGLLQGSDGNFYGTTCYGGNNSNAGTVFRMTPGGLVKILVNFGGGAGEPGQCPEAPLIQATDGNFYGTTATGGQYICGASHCGTIFQLNPAGQFTLLHEFNYANTGPWGPAGGLVQYTDGTFYGITASGGNSTNCNFGCGAIYQLTMPGLGPFVVLDPTAAKVGTTVGILGQGFTSSSKVSFNGTAATLKTVSSTYLTVAVPNGATTGYVTVTTSGVPLKSSQQFRVTPQITSFTPTSGPPGTVVTITGVSLKQTSKVTFGGVAATTFTVNSDTGVTATVPTGAKTGKIGIVTPGGTATSATSFTVTL